MEGDDFFGNLDSFRDRLDNLESLEEEKFQSSTFSRIFYELSTLVNTCLGNFDEVLEAVVDAAFSLTDAERVFLVLLDEEGDTYVHLARNQRGEEIPPGEQKISHTILERVLESEEGVYLADVNSEEGEISQAHSVQELEILSAMCVPLKAEIRQQREVKRDQSQFLPPFLHKILGLLYVDSQSVAPSFDSEKLEFLQLLANYATTAILQARYYEQSTRDPLTEVFTRRYFEVLLDDSIDFARRTNQPFCLVMIDIDHFRKINDQYGYDRGDQVLKEISHTLQENLRPQDMVARYGGDEFALILPETGKGEGRQMAREVEALLSEVLGPMNLSPSLGVALASPNGETGLELRKRVDQALTAAKEKEETNLIVWSEELKDIAPQADKLAGIFVGDAARDYRNILTILETIRDVNSTMELEKLLQLIVDRIIQLSGADRGILVMFEGEAMEVKVARDRDHRELSREEISFSHSVIKKVFNEGKAVCISDTFGGETSDLRTPSVVDLNLRSVMAFPLCRREEILGAIYIDGQSTNPQFDAEELPFFTALGHQIAVALENARLFQENLEKQKRLSRLNKELEKLNDQLEKKVEVQEVELKDVKEELAHKNKELQGRYRFGNIIGKSPKMREVYRILEKVATSEVPVLIQGESGTGKELLAKAIHFNSHRKDKNIVSENCAAVSEELLESELFGHVKGAFTGANYDRKGLFEHADGGTLFLDEIGDMSLGMQKKLLRVLQEEELRRVGDHKKIPVDVRILSATNRDLKDLIRRGEFREDLYYRLNVVNIVLPPLRERREDIPLLTEHLIHKHAEKENKAPPQVPQKIMQAFLQYDWPGNIRELENEICKLLALGEEEIEWKMVSPQIRSEKISFPSLRPSSARPEPLAPPSSLTISPGQSLKDLERKAIIATLNSTGWNKKKSAQQLGITRKTLYNKIDQYNIKEH